MTHNKNKKLTYKRKTFFVALLCILSTTLVLAFKNNITSLFANKKTNTVTGTGQCKNCSELFNDGVAVHEQAYVNEGIIPVDTDEEIVALFNEGVLVEIATNDYYKVNNLEHSQPYILPKAKKFIDNLADTYATYCALDSLTYIPFTITSVTRSKQSVNKLMRGNSNAIENSAHLKGKTFDMSYSAFNGNKKQLQQFVDALNTLHTQQKCFVKFERNGCLHITAN